ncbi:MAG: DUF6048 family protein [Flavobacteriaceae bacterium]
MFKYFIKIYFLLWLCASAGQESAPQKPPVDSVEYKQVYGLRLGIELSKPIRTLFDDEYQGLEIMGDFRITHKLYIAAELGNEKLTRAETLGSDINPGQFEIYDFEVSGSYLKLGVDFNTYENWYGMNNSIFIGGRYAASAFSQTLNNYTLFDSNRYWSPDGFVEGVQPPEEFSGLNTTWLEFIFGIKAELFANFFAGASVRLGFIVTNKESDRMRNLWVPGFGKVTQDTKFGVGYNVSLSYLIPIYKKSKKKEDLEE